MNFIQAVWYLREYGAVVRPASTFRNEKRMYYFDSNEELAPPMLLSCKAMIDMAVVNDGDTFQRRKEDENTV